MAQIQMTFTPEALRSVDTSSLSGSYANLGAVTAHPVRLFKFTNNSNQDITVSYNGGTTDHEFIPKGTFLLVDVCSNRVDATQFVLPQGTQVAVKGAMGSGLFYMSVYYAS